jgi:hypothetical protein
VIVLQLAEQRGDFVAVGDLAERVHLRPAISHEEQPPTHAKDNELMPRRQGRPG